MRIGERRIRNVLHTTYECVLLREHCGEVTYGHANDNGRGIGSLTVEEWNALPLVDDTEIDTLKLTIDILVVLNTHNSWDRYEGGWQDHGDWYVRVSELCADTYSVALYEKDDAPHTIMQCDGDDLGKTVLALESKAREMRRVVAP